MTTLPLRTRTIPTSCFLPLGLLLLINLLTACQFVDKSTSTTLQSLQQPTIAIPEQALLQVGIPTFDTGLDKTSDDDTVLPEVRYAESVYIANQLGKTIEQSGAWGAIRVLPNKTIKTDVYLEATILQSDGETLHLQVTVTDSSGKQWFSNDYKQLVGKYTYDRRIHQSHDPFQNTFNKIANDLLDYRQKLSTKKAIELRTITDLSFAKEFSPAAFADYVTENRQGILRIKRIPAKNDTILQRVQRIREKDYLYVDTMQDYFDQFSQQMHQPYQQWRRGSFDYVVKARHLDKEARMKIWGGVLAIAAGIYGRNTANSGYQQDGSTVGAAAGGVLIKSGLEDKNKSASYRESLSEMGASLSTEIEPQIIKLDDQVITLSGTVDHQYEQWKTLLHKIYEAERITVTTQ
jgi:hypothetical protein